MNKGTFTYCLLQYHHSQLLGEVLNIGLLAYFPEQQQLKFIYPEKLIRLRFAYPDAPEKTIKSYFKYFSQRVGQLNSEPEIFSHYDLSKSLKSFIHAELLPADSSALQFGNYRTSVLYTSDIKHIQNQLYNLYFSVFQVQENETKKVDESVLLASYKNLLKEYSTQLYPIKETKTFHLNYSVQTNYSSNIIFDVAWRDERQTHLVKPISFDLKRGETINKKAYQFYGQFLDLQDLASDKDYLFDVILAKPKARSLFKAYDNALRVLQKPERVTLIEENELVSYSKVTAESALL